MSDNISKQSQMCRDGMAMLQYMLCEIKYLDRILQAVQSKPEIVGAKTGQDIFDAVATYLEKKAGIK